MSSRVAAKKPGSRRPTAWRSTASSIASRTKRASLTALTEILRTKVPRCGRTSTRPASASLMNASRTGVRLTPELLRHLLLRERLPGPELEGHDRVAQRREGLGAGGGRPLDPEGRRVAAPGKLGEVQHDSRSSILESY